MVAVGGRPLGVGFSANLLYSWRAAGLMYVFRPQLLAHMYMPVVICDEDEVRAMGAAGVLSGPIKVGVGNQPGARLETGGC